MYKNFKIPINYRYNLISILIIIYLILMLLPFSYVFFNGYSSATLLFFLNILLLLRIASRDFFKEVFPIFIFAILYFYKNIYSQSLTIHSIMLNIYQTSLLLLPILIGYYLMLRGRNNNIVGFIILLFFFTSVTTAVALTKDPSLSKVISTGNVDIFQITEANKKNIGGFTFIYNIPVIIPMLIVLWRNRKLKTITFFVTISALIIVVSLSQFAIAFLATGFSLLSILLGKNKTFRKVIVLTALIFILFLIGQTYIGDLFYFLDSKISSNMLSERFKAIGDSFKGLVISEESYIQRYEKYLMSIEVFLKYPLFGTFLFEGITGEHSFILDFLAFYGILGLLSLYWFYSRVYKIFYLPFNRTYYYGYMVISFLCGIFIAILNPAINLLPLAFINPIIASRILNK